MNKKGTIVTFMPLKWYLIGIGILILIGGIYYFTNMHNAGLITLPTSCPKGIIPDYIAPNCPVWGDGIQTNGYSCRQARNEGENVNYIYCDNLEYNNQITNLDGTLGKKLDLNVKLVLDTRDNYSAVGKCASTISYIYDTVIFYKVVSSKCRQ